MNLMNNSYRDNRDNEFHYRDITIFIIAQPYLVGRDGRWQQLTHHVALLVPFSGSIDPVVDHCGFTGSAKDCL